MATVDRASRARVRKGDIAGALEDDDRALRIAPREWTHRARLEKMRAEAAGTR